MVKRKVKMENMNEPLIHIRNYRKEYRKSDHNDRTAGKGKDPESDENGYWPESRIYPAPGENRKKSGDEKAQCAFIVPWQME